MSANDTTSAETPLAPERAKELRAVMAAQLLARVDQDAGRRAEALSEYLAVTQAAVEQAGAEALARMVPPLMPALYRRWIGMFLDRLFETAKGEQLEILGDGGEENGAALALAFVMFLESERMERQMAEDLQAFGGGGELAEDQARMADLAASYLRARVAKLAEKDAEKDAAKAAAKPVKKGKGRG